MAVRVSLLPAPASTGLPADSSRQIAITRSVSAAVRVTLSPVVPQGTSTSIPPSTCRFTSRRSAASSSAPSLVNGVTRATPAPANDRAISGSSFLLAALLDIVQGLEHLTSPGAELLLTRLAFHQPARPHPLPVHSLPEQLQLPLLGTQVVGPRLRLVARLPGVARPVEERVARPVALGRGHDLELLVPDSDQVAIVLGLEARPVRAGAALGRGPEALSREFRRIGDLHRIEDRGHEVEGGGEDRAPMAGLHSRSRHDQRDAQRGVEQIGRAHV